MGKVVQLGRQRLGRMQSHVVQELEELLQKARCGDVVSMLYIAQTDDGDYCCARAGGYADDPVAGMVPMLAGIVKLCTQPAT